MDKDYRSVIFLLLTISALTTAYCPRDRIHSTGPCSFRVHCINTIRGVTLNDKCTNSTNEPTVDLLLTDAIERFDQHIDKTFLTSVTSFKAEAAWPQTTLAFLEYMPRLKSLVLKNDQIKSIDGTPFLHLNELENLDLSVNLLSDIEELFQFECHPNKLKTLNLARNIIDNIPGDTFEDLTSLVELDLSYNLISDLSEEPFLNLTKLEVLKLNNNKIKDLNGAVNNLINLKHLYLRGNQIQNIDEPSLTIIYHLETFDVSGNQLERLKPIMFSRHWQHFGKVCKIILSENQITFVPNVTSSFLFTRVARNLKERKVNVLTELDLSKNSINTVEYGAFESIVQLVSLDLSHNQLVTFMVNPNDVSSLKSLNLSSNFISHLYFESFTSMSHLENLDISHNQLYYIPDETFTKNFNLRHVNLTYNGITNLENLRIKMFNPNGGMLDLSNNGVSKLRIPLGEGLRLTVLILNSNHISDAANVDLTYQNELKSLQLSHNQIRQLNESSLHLPLSLYSLNLGFNYIEKIGPSSFYRTTHLQSLYLAYNRLKNIEYGAFQGLTSLSYLDLSFNKIEHLDSKVLTDLKSLKVLSLRYNGLSTLDYNGWLGHKSIVRVYIDGNRLPCDWLGTALSDFNNGYSKMRPAASDFKSRLGFGKTKHSLEGIPCNQMERDLKKSERLSALTPHTIMADERLLVTNQKILEEIKDQSHFLKSILHQLHLNSFKNT